MKFSKIIACHPLNFTLVSPGFFTRTLMILGHYTLNNLSPFFHMTYLDWHVGFPHLRYFFNPDIYWFPTKIAVSGLIEVAESEFNAYLAILWTVFPQIDIKISKWQCLALFRLFLALRDLKNKSCCQPMDYNLHAKCGNRA